MNQSKHLDDLEARRGARLLTLAFLLLLAGLSVAWVPDPQTQSGVVLGELVNGTPGGAVPDDLLVTLHVFSDMEETRTYTTTVTGERSFRFEDVSFREGQTLVARVAYDGVTYVSDFATVEEEQDALSLPVTVYETTQDPAEISISQLHLFVNIMGDRTQVGVYAVIGNAGSRTYTGSPADAVSTTWSAKLPDGAESLQFDGAELGGRFVALEDGFADTRPVLPGGASLETSFTYELPFQEGVQIEQVFDVPVRAAVLVLPEGDWGLRGPGITSEGTLDTQMGAALSYTAGPLAADEPLAFRLVSQSAGTSSAPNDEPSSGLAMGIAALVMAGVAVTLMWRAPSPDPIPPKLRPQVEALAALDHDFQRGGVSEESYREKRRSLKRRLRETLAGQGQ